MSTANKTPKPCCKCNKVGATFTCDGCYLSFCLKHVSDHRQELSQQMDNIGQQHDILKRDIDEQNINKTLLARIDQWEKKSIEQIQLSAKNARSDLKRLTEDLQNRLSDVMSRLSDELRKNPQDHSFTENDIIQWTLQLEELRKDLNILSQIKLIQRDDSSSIRLITIKSHDRRRDNQPDPSVQNAKEKSNETNVSDKLSRGSHSSTLKSELSIRINESSPSQSSSYPSLTFGLNQSNRQDVTDLFKHLTLLNSMDKNGPMSGKCGPQTDQMEQFLVRNFGFKNISGKYIVPGVKLFQLDRSPCHMDPQEVIYFPSDTADSFAMTVQEIIDWQRSYKVYTVKNFASITNGFLFDALQGRSKDGEEAFPMKFVIRISTCPILMEFDAKIISRKLNEDWPNKIKLVSVTGIDFAGRIHDVCDILRYVLNWKEIYEIDSKTGLPLVCNGRDLQVKRTRPAVTLGEDRLLKDLTLMARLRLRACDKEGVQIVVETGIGLGVFSGEHIGIDGNVRLSSALAIRSVLEEDGPTYKNICAIIFALPIIDGNSNRARPRHCFGDFVNQFEEPQYNGSIPVLIADQDMHRLTVAIARHGFIVSQLNPADSHGVFGEYWQNRGPAVEEKLALTTLGLLVQHHLINPNVLDTKNYYFI